MADDFGAYQGSMAFNQYLSLQEDVSLNTGSLTLSKSIINLPGINDSIDLAISLTYAIGVPGILGLPDNWTFSIPYVIPNATVTANGQTNIIDFNWSDESGYHSGLRYVNNHGVLFEAINPPQPLPSGSSGEYAYRYTYRDGSRDYFDATGKLLEHDDLFGNYNYFTYADQFAGVYANYLESVTDSFGQSVQFSYAPNAMTAALPSGFSITINYSDHGVDNFVDELSCMTSFGYGQAAGYDVVSQINYPTGLCTQVAYTTLAYATSAGNAAFPAVSSLVRLDGGSSFLNQINYAYGLNTNGSTYTGFNAGYLLGGSSDSLMDSNNTGYLYDAAMSVVDGQGNLLAYSEYYYNYLHLMLVKGDFLLNSAGAPQPCFQTNNSYDIDVDWHARSTNFNKPTQTVRSAWSAQASQFVPTQQSIFTYDDFGNPLTSALAMYNAATKAFDQQSASTYSYVVADWGGEMPATAAIADVLTGFVHTSTYTLTSDQKNIATTVQTFQNTPSSSAQPWKNNTYTYDSRGRRVSAQLAWSAGAANPNPQLGSATTSYAYAFDLPSLTLTTTKTDPLGNVAVNKTLTSYPGSVLIEAINPLGQSSKFAYDALSRLTTTTDPMGYVTALSYDCVQASGYNRVRSTSAQSGYITDAYCDALGRPIKTMDNGPDAGGAANRVLSQTNFNALGKPASVTGILGLATTFEYDALARVISTTDPHNNVTTVTFGDMQLVATSALNGIRQTQQVSDNLGRTIAQTRYAALADTSIDYFIGQVAAYNGLGQVVSTTLQQCPIAGGQPTTLSVMTKSYDPDAQVIGDMFTGYLSERADASKTIQRDLFGNVSSYAKQVRYPDGRSYSWTSEIFTYDACNNLIVKSNQLNQTETYTYFPTGRMASYRRYDGTAVTYSYDANSNMTMLASGSDAYTYSYYPDNKLKSVSRPPSTLLYQYFLDGVLQETVYPDGKSQKITVDQYSRIVAMDDVSGASTAIVYTPLGQIASKQCGGQTLISHYGVVNGANDILIGASLGGAAAVTYAYSYDGFGRIAETSADLPGQSGPLLNASYSYDAQNRTLGLQTVTGTATSSTNYLYDGFSQVVEQSIVASSAPTQTISFFYDGNTNVISRTINGAPQVFDYNAADQLVGSYIAYDTNGRLVQDGEGGTFAYDAFDKLVSATTSGGTANYAYYPDGMLATRSAASDSSTFYYSDGTASQVRSTAAGKDDWKNYLFQGRTRLASVDSAGKTAYLMAANNSTMAVYDGGTLKPLQYQAYGSQTGEQPDAALFAWKQEYADPDNELVYLRARFYHPSLMRFMSLDSYAVSNRYAFGDGNPIDNIDPTGHLSQSAAMGIGIGVGILATLVTGGALGVVVGTDIVASMAVGAAAGAVGSVAGDATTAALSGQKFTAERALIDLGAGVAGGAVGAGIGGAVGRGTMAYALENGLSRGAITAIGAVSAGVTGGVAGGAAASAVTSAAYGQPFFSSATALNMVVGGVAGLGGGLLGSAAHLGMIRPGNSPVDIMPVEADAAQTQFRTVRFNAGGGVRVVDFSPSDGDDMSAAALRHGNRDAVVVHGFARHLFPETLIGGQNYTQYMTPEAFADLLRNNYGFGQRDLNLWSCFAAKLRLASVAQRIATRLNVDVYAPACRDSVAVSYTGLWLRYTP